MIHPSDRDLINFAHENLGARKQNKILAHCRQCPQCADRLIDATRQHAPDPGPFKLSRWNKLSILFLILMLLATLGGMVWFLNQLSVTR